MKKTALSLAAGLLAITMLCGFTVSEVVERTPHAAPETYGRRQWATAEPITSLVVEQTFSPVEIRQAEDPQEANVVVEYPDTDTGDYYSFAIENGTLTVKELKNPPDETQGATITYNLPFYKKTKTTAKIDPVVKITLPQREYATITIKNGGKSSLVENITAQRFESAIAYRETTYKNCTGGDFICEGLYAGPTLENCTAQKITVHTDYGSFSVKNGTAQEISFNSTFGSATFDRASANVFNCNTGLGAIEGTIMMDYSTFTSGYVESDDGTSTFTGAGNARQFSGRKGGVLLKTEYKDEATGNAVNFSSDYGISVTYKTR